MFTGIVEEAGEVVAARDEAGDRRLRIDCEEVGGDLHHGQSIAVSGVCLTVEEFGARGDSGDERWWFEVFLAEETVRRTYLGDVSEGDRLNLERAMPADGRLDGHVVQGHVDCTTEVVEIREVGDDWTFEFAVPPGYGKYIAEKGSIALDGISLTVAERLEDTFTVAVIPTTYDLTNFCEKEAGDPVHVEIDVLARYAERLLEEREEPAVPVRGDGDESVGAQDGDESVGAQDGDESVGAQGG